MITAREQRELEHRLRQVLNGSQWFLACSTIGQMIADRAWNDALRRGELPRGGMVPRWVAQSLRARRRVRRQKAKP